MRRRSFCVAILAASIMLPTTVLAQSVVAPGRVEGAGPVMSIGVAAIGTVSEILVHGGSRVRAGDTLVKFNCQPLEADLHARQAHVRAAQANFDRVRNGSRPDEIVV